MIEVEDYLRSVGVEAGDRARAPRVRPALSLVGCGGSRAPSAATRLYTATLAGESGGAVVQAFAALVAEDPAVLEFTLSCRFGSGLASAACIRDGFDAGHPLVDALVSPAMSHILTLIDRDPTSELAEGLDVLVEQRFAS